MIRWTTMLAAGLAATATLTAREPQPGEGSLSFPVELVVEPAEATLEVGEELQLRASVFDAQGEPVERKVVFYSRARQSVAVDASGKVRALRPGEHTLVALVPKDPEDEPRRAEPLLKREVTVSVPPPPIAELRLAEPAGRPFAGTLVALRTTVVDATGTVRHDVDVRYSVSDESVAAVDRFGDLHLLSAGPVTVTAKVDALSTALDLEVRPNPIASLELDADASQARTGDVVRFWTVARDEDGRVVEDAPVHFAVSGEVHPEVLAPGAPAFVDQEGVFVAERSGLYRVVATSGSLAATRTLEVRARDVGRELEAVGHGPVRDRHTSDLWVWEAPDGRDYAIVGTWGAGGHAFVWDVTNPEAMVVVDTVRVDARTVNDVKVDAEGRLAVISREGASDRKNGIVLLDVSEPQKGVRIVSRFDDQLNGGVHNLFIWEGHVYAVNNSRRFDVINVEDPERPYRVGRFELDAPGAALHDIWIVDGVAFTSNWKEGVVAIDVGGAGAGGSPSRPKKLGQYVHPSGRSHAAFPYRSPSTGKFYVFAGDEAFPYGDLHTGKGGPPIRAAGWIHVIEWETWDSPREVARYQVPEAGSHNFWLEDDVLYVAYYNAGLRVVDVSGQLRGDLYRQGREIAFWVPLDPEGYVPNAAFTWGVQPFRGHLFVSDWYSGLWAVRLEPKTEPTKVIGEPR